MLQSTGYKFLWLILIVATVLECNKIKNDIRTKEQTVLEDLNVVEKVFLRRKKRFLIFEKGAQAAVQINIAKSIISAMPRGLNEITEYTLTYDLPWETEIPKIVPTRRPTTTASTTTIKSTTVDSTMWWNYYDKQPTWLGESKWQPKKKLWCPKQHIFQKYYDYDGKNALPWCDVQNLEYRKSRQKRKRSFLSTNSPKETFSSKGTTLLFDLITHLANMHGFNARHCIMRTLCESRHLLLPPGRLLFHDLVRILLSYAQPATRRHAPFRAAIHRENLQECMQLYGLHCRWSFLQHFTESIGTAANSMAISPILLRSIQHAEFM